MATMENKRQAGGGFLVFLFGAVTSILSLRMPIGSFRAAGPGLFPLSLGILLMILSGFFVVRNLRAAGMKETKKAAGFETRDWGSTRRVVFFLGTMVLVTLLLKPLGYLAVSFLLLLSLLRVLGARGWFRSVLLSFFAALISYLLFVHWLKIPLPSGWLGF